MYPNSSDALICSSGPPGDPYGAGWEKGHHPLEPDNHSEDEHDIHSPFHPSHPGHPALPIDIFPPDPLGGFNP
jgi:hypothetical protein